MSITTLTFASFRFASSTAPTQAPAAVEPPAAAPAPAAPKAGDACACPPRRHGLADAVKQATGAENDADGDLRDAVMDFARVLMQALRSEAGGSHREHGHDDDDGDHRHRDRHDDEGRRSHGHHRHHHRHHDDGEGYSMMRSLGDRIQSLAQSLAPAAPDRPDAPDAPASPASPKGGWSPASTAAVLPLPAPEPKAAPTVPVDTATTRDDATADATAEAATTGWSAEVTVVRFQISGSATPYARMQDRLLEAFDHLRQAQGAPAAADKDTLRDDLRSFLEQLATGLGADTADSLAAPTAPGALLDLAA